MGFWEDLSNGLDRVGKRLNDFGEDAARATRDFSRQQKLKAEIAEEKRVINTQFLKLGKKYYEEHQNDTGLDEAEQEMFGKIVRARKDIKEYEDEIAKLKEDSEAARAAAAEAAEAEDAARAAEEEGKSGASAAGAETGKATDTEPSDQSNSTSEPADAGTEDSDFEEE